LHASFYDSNTPNHNVKKDIYEKERCQADKKTGFYGNKLWNFEFMKKYWIDIIQFPMPIDSFNFNSYTGILIPALAKGAIFGNINRD
jgi:hypothetical protein